MLQALVHFIFQILLLFPRVFFSFYCAPMVLVAIIRNAGGERVAAGFSRAQSGQEQTRARRRSIKAAAALGRRGGGRGGPAARAAVRHLFLFKSVCFLTRVRVPFLTRDRFFFVCRVSF